MFKEYQHIERFGRDEVMDIDIGVCFIFPKIDGTNSSVWRETYHPNITPIATPSWNILKTGSRTRELSLTQDNAGFHKYVDDNSLPFHAIFDKHPTWRLYGEFLVPHSLKTYREDAWRKFYVFDVFDDELEEYIPYKIYQLELAEHGIDYIPPICVISDPSIEQLQREMENNTYLIQDGMGSGEGIVIKNYDYRNKWGRTTWAKLVRNEFKEKNAEAFGVREMDGKKIVEKEFAETYVTQEFVDKTRAKIETILREGGGPAERKALIPRLLETCFHDLVVEETWDFLKNKKNPTIDFKKLRAHVIHIVKLRARDLF